MDTGTTTDLVAALRDADANTIRRRLADLEAERKALCTLLRSLAARDSVRARAAKAERIDHAR